MRVVPEMTGPTTAPVPTPTEPRSKEAAAASQAA
jgi:hypothetical protein